MGAASGARSHGHRDRRPNDSRTAAVDDATELAAVAELLPTICSVAGAVWAAGNK